LSQYDVVIAGDFHLPKMVVCISYEKFCSEIKLFWKTKCRNKPSLLWLLCMYIPMYVHVFMYIHVWTCSLSYQQSWYKSALLWWS
jgi:hypothetical protein